MWKINTLILLLLLGSFEAPPVSAQVNFKAFGYGPYDYTNPMHYRDYLPVVEQYHFNSDIESLRASIDNNSIGSHLMYVIRSFPNHHRALMSAAKLWEQSDPLARPPPGVTLEQTPDFLYLRAIEFAPADGTVRLLYGIYLLKIGQKQQALARFDQAAELAPDTADTNYNLGLMYLRVNEYGKANVHALKAYEQGHPLPGLRNMMIAEGIWSE